MRPDYRNPPSRASRTSKPTPEAAYLWTLSGLALLAACGGGGGGGSRPTVHNPVSETTPFPPRTLVFGQTGPDQAANRAANTHTILAEPDDSTTRVPADARTATTPVAGANPVVVAGRYGTFSVTRNDGEGTLQWRYILGADGTPSQMQFDEYEELGAGERAYEKITFIVTDPSGGNRPLSDYVTVTGVNDEPVLTPITATTPITDSGPLTTGDTFMATDADANDTPTFRVAGSRTTSETGFTHQVAHTFGTLYYNANTGAWRFDAGGAAFTALTPSDTEQASFTVTAWDGTASSPSQNLGISVTGRDDRPTLTVVETDIHVREGGLNNAGRDANANGRIAISDPDTGQSGHVIQAYDTATTSHKNGSNTANGGKGENFPGIYGTLYLKADYTWTYELYDETTTRGAALQALTGGQVVTDGFAVRVDGDDLANEIIQIVVTGSDETTDGGAPPPGPVATGVVLSDLDGDAVNFEYLFNGVAQTHRGSSYSPDAEFHASLAAIGNSYAFDADYTVTVTSGESLATTVTGDQVPDSVKAFTPLAQDKAAWRGFDLLTAGIAFYRNFNTGQERYVYDGRLVDSHDDGDVFSVGYRRTVVFNTLRVDGVDLLPELGSLSQFAALRQAGFTVSGNALHWDGIIRVVGANDTPVLDPIATPHPITDNGNPLPDRMGTFTASDRDANDTLTFHVANARTTSEAGFTNQVAGNYGTLFYNSGTGAWKYEPNAAAITALGRVTQQDGFAVTANDGTADSNMRNLTIAVTGPATAPAVGAPEIVYLINPLLGRVHEVDEDDNQAATIFSSASNQLTVSDSDDGTDNTLVFKTGVASGSTEPAAATSLTASARGMAPATAEGAYGDFTFSWFGRQGTLRWDYTLKSETDDMDAYNAVQALNTGEFLYEKLTVVAMDQTADSAPIDVLIKIVGHTEGTDKPNEGPNTRLAPSSGSLSDSGEIDNTDTGTVSGGYKIPDDFTSAANMQFRVGHNHGHNQPAFIPHDSLTLGALPSTVTGEYGTFTLTWDTTDADNGELTWSYDPDNSNNAVSDLYNGQFLYDQLTVHVEDEAGERSHDLVSVKINGTGNKPAGVTNAPPTLDFFVERSDQNYITFEDSNAETGTFLRFADIETTNANQFSFKYGVAHGTAEPTAAAATTPITFTSNMSTGHSTTYGSLSFELSTQNNYIIWLYQVDKTNATVRALDGGEFLYEKLTLVANDGTSDSHPVEMLIRIFGLYDAQTIPNNTPPTAANATKTASGSAASYGDFSISDFGFMDADGHDLEWITITDLPTSGTLSLDAASSRSGNITKEGTNIAPEDIQHLTFTPTSGTIGAASTHVFEFTVSDGADDSLAEYMFTIQGM